MANYGSQDFKCPYYKGDDEKKINCEGTFTNFCTQIFKSEKKKKLYKEEYCCSFDYKKCPYCKMLDQNYKSKT